MDEGRSSELSGSAGQLRRLARLGALAAALIDSDDAVLNAATEREVYQGLCRTIVRHLELPLVWIGLAEPATQRLSVQISCGAQSGALDDPELREGGDLPLSGIAGEALRTGVAHSIADLDFRSVRIE